MMKRLLIPILLLAFVIANAATASVSDLVKHPEKYDQKVVTATGVVAKFEAKTSKIGKKYVVFEVMQGKDFINVYGKLELAKPPKNGDKVSVTGTFEKEHKMRTFSVKDQVEIKSATDLKILHK